MSRALQFPTSYSETRVLEDGTAIGLRLLRPGDRELLFDRTPERTSDGRSVTYELDLPELTDEAASTGPLYDFLRAAGRGLEVLLHSLRAH